MASVSITELKAHLGEYLRRAQAGERFPITYRGKEIAELAPPDPVRATLLHMVDRGDADWNGYPPSRPDGFYPNPGRPVSDVVSEDRGPYPPDADPETA